jgi:hypothetical protein
MESFILGIVLWIVIGSNYVFLRDYFPIVPAEWLYIASFFYLLGIFNRSRPGSRIINGRFNAIFALGLVLMLMFGALTNRNQIALSMRDPSKLAMSIAVVLVFDVFFITLMATIYWVYDRWEQARAERAAHADRAARDENAAHLERAAREARAAHKTSAPHNEG